MQLKKSFIVITIYMCNTKTQRHVIFLYFQYIWANQYSHVIHMCNYKFCVYSYITACVFMHVICVCLCIIIIVTKHEKTRFMCTKYTCSYFEGYLAFHIIMVPKICISFIWLSMLFCLSAKNSSKCSYIFNPHNYSMCL